MITFSNSCAKFYLQNLLLGTMRTKLIKDVHPNAYHKLSINLKLRKLTRKGLVKLYMVIYFFEAISGLSLSLNKCVTISKKLLGKKIIKYVNAFFSVRINSFFSDSLKNLLPLLFLKKFKKKRFKHYVYNVTPWQIMWVFSLFSLSRGFKYFSFLNRYLTIYIKNTFQIYGLPITFCTLYFRNWISWLSSYEILKY